MRRAFKRWLAVTFNTWRAPQVRSLQRFAADNFARQLNTLPPLGAEAVVLDFGAYKGEFIERVLTQTKAKVVAFEAHPGFAKTLADQYQGNPRVTVHGFALGSSDDQARISESGDASSLKASGGGLHVEIMALERFLKDINPLPRVDLMKVNIEGGEYDLLPALANAGVLLRIQEMHIQFHLFKRGDLESYATIKDQITQTHEKTFSYPYVWEGWRKKPA